MKENEENLTLAKRAGKSKEKRMGGWKDAIKSY
jgi:hypothetical protein